MTQIAATPFASHALATAQIELGLEAVVSEARPAELPAHSRLGYELGWDFAHHGLTPPIDHLFQASPLLAGWQAGRATFGQRTLKASRHVKQWLQLRTHAWSRGRQFETLLVTPNYLQQLEASHCPILRCALEEQGSIDRVRDDAGYAAGNLVQMSATANAAKASHDHASADEMARSLALGPIQQVAGLDPLQWQRIAVLCSFVTPLSHEQAAQIPLKVLPPNRLRMFNPIQALQALVTRQLATPGWSQRLARLEALLPGEALKADFNRFVLALVPRVLKVEALLQPHEIRWALEDAWADALVMKRWTRFALALTAEQAEALVQRAAAKKLAPVHVQTHGEQAATEGWALSRRGYRAAS
ncbi:hypothetical protein [Pelomonas sp. SE-A7]|uniref:hypothetical protein n=1 Tax=Pelomonas sp. SE-A7 TaxID=3054953 RepID=UPI00259D0B05|nr:hypothetical protein [Pelomonas sp. SE-A7]MDM4768494.1 hypothetical protein [Pelomonas sp. SE-A7]